MESKLEFRKMSEIDGYKVFNGDVCKGDIYRFSDDYIATTKEDK